jgi:hypothetical protein
MIRPVLVAAAYLDTLNPEQRRAVEHGVREQDSTPGPPLLVIAGAGSGKTSTLAHRVAHLLVNGADPRRILLMTFSRRAAGEMTRRVERITRRVIGQRADIMTDALAWAGTFHGIGARLLRDYGDQIGLAEAVSDPLLAADIGGRWDHILVDEYQDTNRLQSSILLALKPEGCGLTVVSDDAQSIYSFRAATVRNILDFPSTFSPWAEIITLDRNYRSTKPILAAANGVIDLARERFTKNLWTERDSAERPQLVTVRDETDQARYIVEQVLSNREVGTTLKQQAVLFRASSHSGPLEVELTRCNIPFVKFGGLKFLDSAHVKDILALLRFVQNPRDRVAGFRLMQLLPGVGPTSAQRVLDAMVAEPDPLAVLSEVPAPPRSGDDWTTLVATLQTIRAGDAAWPAEVELACDPRMLFRYSHPMRQRVLEVIDRSEVKTQVSFGSGNVRGVIARGWFRLGPHNLSSRPRVGYRFGKIKRGGASLPARSGSGLRYSTGSMMCSYGEPGHIMYGFFGSALVSRG